MLDQRQEETELYDAAPSDPVKPSKVKCNKDVVENAYSLEDIDYYQENYLRYWEYVESQNFLDMKAKLARKPSTKVCHNVEVRMQNGTAMGDFKCPLSFEHRDLTSCCGHRCAQFCCSPNYLNDREKDLGALAFALIIIAVICVGLLFYFYLGRKM